MKIIFYSSCRADCDSDTAFIYVHSKYVCTKFQMYQKPVQLIFILLLLDLGIFEVLKLNLWFIF